MIYQSVSALIRKICGKIKNIILFKTSLNLLKQETSPSVVDWPLMPRPDVFCLVQGAAEGNTPLNAFDNALLNAGIGDLNLVRLSSIIPPGATQICEETLNFPAGGFLPIAYAHVNSNTSGQIISAAVAVGIPEDPNVAGVIMEHGANDPLIQTESVAQKKVQDAFKSRNRELKEIRLTGIEHQVEKCGTAIAGIVLWWSEKAGGQGAGGSL